MTDRPQRTPRAPAWACVGVLAALLLVVALPGRAYAQPGTPRWNSLVAYDGQSSWQRYLVLAPGYMGPNALPVARVGTSLIPQNSRLLAGLALHEDARDRTLNPTLQLALSLAKGRVMLGAEWVPVEVYQTTAAERDRRRARGDDTTGHNPGDVTLRTSVQLLRQGRWPLNLRLDLDLKTTAGKNLENARHLNAPAYRFRLVGGHRWALGGGPSTDAGTDTSRQYLRLDASAGFLAWQTGFGAQNDAPTFGLALTLGHGPAWLTMETAGYVGWQGRGDRPLVTVLEVGAALGRWRWHLAYRHGWQHQPTHGVQVGAGWRFRVPVVGQPVQPAW